MIKEIASILKDRLIGLPFIEVVAGLAQRVEWVEKDADDNIVRKRMPVAYDTNVPPGCSVTPEKALVPDSFKKGICYFEDNGISFVDTISGGAIHYQANLTFVCWMNRSRLVGDAYEEITSYCITNVIQRLSIRRPMNIGNFSRFTVLPGRIMPQDAGVFFPLYL